MADIDDIKNMKFSFEQEMKDEVILKFSNKQGGDFNVFAYHWQCFVWAATIGFVKDLRLPLTKKLADKTFSLSTMSNNDGEKNAQALICMCIAKTGTLDIIKNPDAFINTINEYANGGFYYIQKLLKEEGTLINDLEFVKREVFTRAIE